MTTAPVLDRCSKSEYARHRGVDASLISRWAKQHKIVLDTDGKVVISRSDALLAAVLHPTKGGGRARRAATPTQAAHSGSQALPAGKAMPTPDATPNTAPPPAGAGQGSQPGALALTVAEATTAEKIERTRLLRLELGQKAGDLLRRDVVEGETFKRARQAQESLMALKDRLVPLLANESDEHAIDMLLDAELRQVVAVIAGSTVVPAAAPEPEPAAAPAPGAPESMPAATPALDTPESMPAATPALDAAESMPAATPALDTSDPAPENPA